MKPHEPFFAFLMGFFLYALVEIAGRGYTHWTMCLTGGLILGACFMATDYVTSPMSLWGGVVFGVGIGFLTMMIRYFGSYPEGMSFAILIMNAFVPLLNMWFQKKKYGRK